MKLRPALALLGGITLCLIGGALIAAYVLEAVSARWGEADQSLLFWYLPLLFFGIIALGTGTGPCLWGIRQLTRKK